MCLLFVRNKLFLAENRAGGRACGNVSYIVDDDDNDDVDADDDDNDDDNDDADADDADDTDDADADDADDADDSENPRQLSSGKPEAMFPTLLTCFSACQEGEFGLLRILDPLL